MGSITSRTRPGGTMGLGTMPSSSPPGCTGPAGVANVIRRLLACAAPQSVAKAVAVQVHHPFPKTGSRPS